MLAPWKKSGDTTLPTKIRLFKAMVFPVFMDGYKSWTTKKAECQRTVVLEKTLENPFGLQGDPTSPS